MIATFFNFKPGDFFTVVESEKNVPRVDLKLPA
jgi:hypothetical protein